MVGGCASDDELKDDGFTSSCSEAGWCEVGSKRREEKKKGKTPFSTGTKKLRHG
jgi:hypothetical protein